MRFVEKYRPKSWDEIVSQPQVVEPLRAMLKRGKEIPHLLFLGPAGTGKTSVAHLVAKELGFPIHELNASDDRGIDIVRGFIKRVSRIRGRRVILLDEVDNMTGDAMQALRRTMEKTIGTVFILTGNRGWKIIDPIQSRCALFRFQKFKNGEVLRRLLEICRAEGISIKPEMKNGFTQLVWDSKGDLRKAINTLETIVTSGKKISPEAVIGLQKPKIAGEALRIAVSGDFVRAKEMLEDGFINARFGVDDVLDELYEAVGSLKVTDAVKARLYKELKDTDRNCRLSTNPVIQFIGFIAFAWICPHLPQNCPALEG